MFPMKFLIKIMKSYTDIEQSKKLAEILPNESADQTWEIIAIAGANLGVPEEMQYWHNGNTPCILNSKIGIPCWSLAALLEILPNEISTSEKFVDKYQIDIRKHDGEDGATWYQIAYGNDRGSSGEWHDMINTGEKENIIDCCFQMILKLKERNLL